MYDNEFIKEYSLKENNVELEKAVLVSYKKRQKNSKEYNCFCIRAGYNNKYIEYLHENKYEASYIKKTKERAVNADEHDIKYVMEPLELFFDYIILDKKIGLRNLNYYEKIKEDKENIYFLRKKEEIPLEIKSMLFIEDKEINKESLVNILESKIMKPEDIDSICVLNEKMEWVDLSKYYSVFSTKQKELFFKINIARRI